MTTRLLSPPTLVAPYSAWVNGSQYVGQAIDVTPPADVLALEALGWVPIGGGNAALTPAQSGPSTARPNVSTAGTCFVDTTLQQVVTWDGAAWRNPIGGARV